MPHPIGPKKRKKIKLKKERKRAREAAALKQLQDRRSNEDAKIAKESEVLGHQQVIRPERNPERPNRISDVDERPVPPPQLLDAIHEFLLDYRYIEAAHGMRTDNQKRPGHSIDAWKQTSRGLPFLSDIFIQWKEQNPETVEQAAVERKRALAEGEGWELETDEAEGQKKELKRKRRDLAVEAARAEANKDFNAVADAQKKLEKAKKKQKKLDDRPVSDSEEQSVDEEAHREPEPSNQTPKPAIEDDASDTSSDGASHGSSSGSSSSSSDDEEQTSHPKPTPAEKPPITTTKTNEDSSASSASSSDNEASTTTTRPTTTTSKKRPASDPVTASPSSSSSLSSSSDSEAEAPPTNGVSQPQQPSPAPSPSSSSSSSDTDSSATPPAPKRRKLDSSTTATATSTSTSTSADGIPPPRLEKDTFSRVPTNQKIEARFSSNAYVPYDYAQRAYNDLSVVKGKGFTKEKNKKKRGQGFRGGTIDIESNRAIKFED